MNKKIRTVFKELDQAKIKEYSSYWGDLTVNNHDDYFRRYLFAFCSVHTTWESNVRGYQAIEDFEPWINSKETLRRRLYGSGCGLHNNRTEFIFAFAEKFWYNPAWYYPLHGEGWTDCRNRLVQSIKGLGLAKTSFALEMSFPLECDAACLDVHMLRLYGDVDAGPDKVRYNRFEKDWVKRSKDVAAPPYMARCVYWDKLQGRENSRYWSKVLEK